MKLYLIRSYDFGSPRRAGAGFTTAPFTSVGEARKGFRAEVKRLRKLQVRFEVKMFLATAEQPTLEDWKDFFRIGDFNHITLELLQTVKENAGVTQ